MPTTVFLYLPGISLNNISSNSFFLSAVSLRFGFNMFVPPLLPAMMNTSEAK